VALTCCLLVRVAQICALTRGRRLAGVPSVVLASSP
jgi:hypothetical protein